MMDFKLFAVFLIIISATQGQFYEDRRCRCICPSPSSLLNSTQSIRKVFISNVPANKCNCEEVILPKIGEDLKDHKQEFCLRCECKYETRNTTIILYDLNNHVAPDAKPKAESATSNEPISAPPTPSLPRRGGWPPTYLGPRAPPAASRAAAGRSVQRLRFDQIQNHLKRLYNFYKKMFLV